MTHETFQDQLPLFAAGQLSAEQAAELENHLRECAACRADLALWNAVATEISGSDSPVAGAPSLSKGAPASLADRALERIHTSARVRQGFLRVFSLLRSQAYLIKREMWPTSAAMMALGVAVALVSNRAEAITLIAPMVAAASLAMLYGPEHDPAHELTISTPTSSWKILLARLSTVSAYNLALALLASLAMLLIMPPALLGMLTLGWLAPMAFLSALALLLSLWIGTGNAIMLSYGLWILQFLRISRIFDDWRYSSGLEAFQDAYRGFWHSPGLLFILALALVGAALLSTRYTENRLNQLPA
jgi:hypothetical protein